MGKCLSSHRQHPKGHYCSNSCLIDYKEKGKKELLKSLKMYHAEYVLDIIMQYLPTYDLQKYETERTKLISYLHQQSLTYYIDKLAPCNKWKMFSSSSQSNYYNYYELKVSLCGAAGSGKSSICNRILCDFFVDEIDDPTIDEGMTKCMNINGCNILYDILDPWSQHEFQSLLDMWLRESFILFICFGIDDQDAFQDVAKWRERILKVKSEYDDNNDFAMIMVGTKCDLRNDNEWIKRNNPSFIDEERILQCADEWSMPYIETSAKMGDNVVELFEYALYEYWMQSQTSCHL